MNVDSVVVWVDDVDADADAGGGNGSWKHALLALMLLLLLLPPRSVEVVGLLPLALFTSLNSIWRSCDR